MSSHLGQPLKKKDWPWVIYFSVFTVGARATEGVGAVIVNQSLEVTSGRQMSTIIQKGPSVSRIIQLPSLWSPI